MDAKVPPAEDPKGNDDKVSGGADGRVVERLLAGGDLHDLFRVERILRESYEHGDLVLLLLPAAAAGGAPSPPASVGPPSDDSTDGTKASAAPAPAVMVLKSHETLLQPRHVAALLRPSTRFVPLSHNDVYYFYTAEVENLGPVWTKVVYPSPESEVQYWMSQEQRVVRETPQLYNDVVLPYIRSLPPERNAWIDNIFQNTESERVIFKDEHFVLLDDAKWDGETKHQLHCLALVCKKGIHTMRDLRQEDIPLLRHVLDHGAKAIESTYGVTRNQLKIFVHHLPSFFHLHIHFCSVYADPRQSQVVRAHLVEDIIDALEQHPDHFSKLNITYVLGENHPLYQTLMKP